MDPVTSFADWVRQRRHVLGLTQAALARQVGCALVTIKKIEQEVRRPSREMAEALADRLAIPARQRQAFLRLAAGEYVKVPIAAAEIPALPASSPTTGGEANQPSFVARDSELAQLDI